LNSINFLYHNYFRVPNWESERTQ